MAMHTASTANGYVRGVSGNDPAFTVFKGIPYAAPPVGENRWRAPQPVRDWEGIYKADHFHGGCPQAPFGEVFHHDTSDSFEPFDEDCLYLNIWTPAKVAGEKLPVFFWIPGGANVKGWGHLMFADGEAFCKKGVIFVSFNWRVNVFGWLTHPELDRENPEHVSGNYAVLDQIAALRWVKKNIAAFGGDPDNITVAGESAGGSSVMNLCTTPMSRGLFQHASMQSGGGWDLFGRNSVLTLAESENITDLEKLFGVKTIAEARALPAEEIVRRFSRPEAAGGYLAMHVKDGYVFPKTNREAALAGELHPVDYIIGHTFEETHMYDFPVDREIFLHTTRAEYGDLTDEYLKLCGFLADDDAFRNYLRVRSAEMLKTGAIAFAETLEKQGRPVYMYCFTREQPGDDYGSYHSSELWYQFGTLNRSWRPFIGRDYELSDAMQQYWCNFARTGDPNGGELPHWEKYTSDKPEMMELGLRIGMKNFGEDPRVTFRKRLLME